MVGKEPCFTTKDDDFGENIGLGCALEMFSEAEEVMGIIDNLKNIYDTSGSELEGQYDKLYTILKQYYEQPHLLDPHLDRILSKFITILRKEDSPASLKHATFNYMYQIIRVRGYKVVVRHLPHEISDLVPVLTFLEAQDPNNTDTWRSRFVLLLWLSIISMMPFHMARLDGFALGEKDSSGAERKTVMSRIFDICKTYSEVKDCCSDAGAFLSSKFLTRSDVKELYLKSFFEWSCKENSNLHEEDNTKYGVLNTVAAILKHGKREDLLPYADMLLEWVTKQNFRQNKAMLARKYAIKIIQRIGLTYLRSRVASWRYTRGSRTLAANLQAAGDMDKHCNAALQAADPQDSAGEENLEDEEDQDIPEQIEEVIEQLLLGLRDSDNIVRWSAAKGLGRVSGRLSHSAAGDVATSLMELFSRREGDGAWHGGCLALAELGRRGLLLPSQLPGAVDVVLKALQYEELRGHAATGQHVRDAACYVCWAFARAYDATVLQPFVNRIAAGLIITAVFDREIHCRRAASAAFQEHVGRQGSFPNGIDILTAADFFSVGIRNNAFLNVAPWVAGFSDYTQPLIDHLLDRKVDHWDIAIRELTAKALHKLSEKAPRYMADVVLPKLLEKTLSIDLNARHGAILALGEIIYALHLIDLPEGRKADMFIQQQLLESVKNIVSVLNSKYLFRGMGGELMRQACCSCIERLSLAQVDYHGDKVIDEWLALIDECLGHEVIIIREKAILALSAVFNEYLNDTKIAQLNNEQATKVDVDGDKNGECLKEKRNNLLIRYCHQLENLGSTGMFIRTGNSLAIGALPKFALEEHLPLVIESLIKCSKVTEPTTKWAESRRDAIKGLTNVCQTTGIQTIQRNTANGVQQIFHCLIDCLEEYTVDMRGDIGAWVREASMTGLLSLCKQCAAEDPSVLSPELMQRVMLGVAQQSVEKIDRTRAYGGKVFASFLHTKPKIPNIPNHTELLSIFPHPPDDMFASLAVQDDSRPIVVAAASNESPTHNTSAVLWLFAEHTMPRFIKLLDLEVYRYSIMLGLTVSAGDMTENLVKHTTGALFSYLSSLHSDVPKLNSICNVIVKVFSDNVGNNRVIIPMLKFLDRLLSSGCMAPIIEDPQNGFANEILKLVKIVMREFTNVYKRLDSISVLCQLLQVGGNVCRASLVKLMVCVCNGQKYIRKSTATRLYDALLIYGDTTGISEENVDQAMQILADTNWDLDPPTLRPIRNSICDLLGIPHPIAVSKNNPPE